MSGNGYAEWLFSAVVGVACLPLAVHAEPLSVQVEEASAELRSGPNVRWAVFLEGTIDPGSAERVGRELALIGDDRADVYLDSPGGSLSDGMQIGLLLRRLRANTLLGKRGSRNSGLEPGVCLSACSIAFLGGVQRYVSGGSVYGVHRVSTSVRSETDFAAGQIVSAQLSSYIRDMGVDSRLLERMAGTDKDRIYIVGAPELRALHVVDDGRRPAQWRSQFTEQGPSLVGSQESAEGTDQVLLACDKGRVKFHSIYHAGSNADRLASEQRANSLLIDDTPLPLDAPTSIEDVNGDLNATFTLSPDQERRMVGAASIGLLMEGGRSDPSIAYKIDIDPRAGLAMKNFMRSCSELR
jgi:hypothetical protein